MRREFATMGLTMGFPNQLSWYPPVFHLNALWFAATGCVIVRSGVSIAVNHQEGTG